MDEPVDNAPRSTAFQPSEMAIAVLPDGSKRLSDHLEHLYDDRAWFRVDDYHLGMAVTIILSPQNHVDALVDAGVLIPTKKGYRVRGNDV